MKAVRALLHYVVAVLTLGSLAFIFQAILNHVSLDYSLWSSDAPYAWALSIVYVALFLALVCMPLKLLLKGSGKKSVWIAAIICGPMFVWSLLLLRGDKLSLENFVSAPGVLSMHIVFFLVAILFFWGSGLFRRNGQLIQRSDAAAKSN